jgi:hypothetical protein
MIDTFYVTGSTAGLYPNEINEKFNPICEKLRSFGAIEVICVSQINSIPGMEFKDLIDLRLSTVASVQCIVFTDDWKETIESRFEFKEARRLKKEIRMNTHTDITDIQHHLKNSLSQIE